MFEVVQQHGQQCFSSRYEHRRNLHAQIGIGDQREALVDASRVTADSLTSFLDSTAVIHREIPQRNEMRELSRLRDIERRTKTGEALQQMSEHLAQTK